MSRSAFLSAGGDVFLADFTLKLWNERWRDEIDTMYVAYNNHAEVPQETAHEFLHKWEKDPKVRLIYTPNGIGNGNPITQMLFNSHEDLLLLLEDDSFIFTPGVVDKWFRLVEFGLDDPIDVVGSPRYSVGEVADAAKLKYDLDYSGVGDHGFGWWPSFFVTSRENLLKTDLDFGSKKYSKGEYFKELNHTFSEDCFTDTFTWSSLQLRYMGAKSYDISQNHAHPFDLDFQRTHEIMFANGDPKYIHGGSLSSGWGGYLNKKLPSVATDMEKQDIETRVAFWTICMDNTKGYTDFKNQYADGIDNLKESVRLSSERIQKKINLYRSLMKI